MGARKQKWTAEEESALKAGVRKHGTGKWRNILRDPEFSMSLQFRSNIDLKDKWRNMAVIGSGGSVSRERSKLANKKCRPLPKGKQLEGEYNPMSDGLTLEDDMAIDVTPVARMPPQIELEETKKSLKGVSNLILEAVTQLHQHSGSNKTSIATYIEEKFRVPPNFQMVLSAKLKALVDSGKLIKVNRHYKLAPSSAVVQQRTPRLPPPRTENGDVRKLTMVRAGGNEAVTLQEAADSAARAVAEAEIAEAEAEEATREAEEIEADAQAAQAFVETMIFHLKNRNSAPLMIQAA